MGNILTSCVCPKVSSNCGWHSGKVASSYESDFYEVVAATKSESTTVEPGKLDVGATGGHDLQHISNQKMPTGSPEDSLSLKSLPPSEEDNDDAQILPSRVRASPEDNLSLVALPRSEDSDCDDDDDAQILPSRVQGSSGYNLSLVTPPPSEDYDCDDEEEEDDVQILPSRVQAWPEDRLFLRCKPRYKDEEDDAAADCDDDCDDDDDVHGTAWNENDLTLESISDEETHPGRELRARKNPMGKGSQEPQVIPADWEEGLKEGV
ncbi:aspartate-rich protein 1-like isoform X4 [Papio anubis]|uniref:aspartate-rich protein 1-like isoform X4 n=1 Tax=Papio anubis TaxID=9555 RepID=UPI0012AE9208|nr:aspartate-rich protein 1-like isoform X4 [Papio anubis]